MGLVEKDSPADRYEAVGSGEARRFLKHLDRRLQRFSNRIDSFEERASRLSDEDDADVILAVESLHRETLLLRAEIREHLARGNQSLAELTEYAEESWAQLKETFEELRVNLEPEETAARSSGSRRGSDDEGEDEEWVWDEDEWLDGGEDLAASEVHPPRVGPKR